MGSGERLGSIWIPIVDAAQWCAARGQRGELFSLSQPLFSLSNTHTHSLSLVLVIMMKSKELKTKISHAHSLPSLSLSL